MKKTRNIRETICASSSVAATRHNILFWFYLLSVSLLQSAEVETGLSFRLKNNSDEANRLKFGFTAWFCVNNFRSISEQYSTKISQSKNCWNFRKTFDKLVNMQAKLSMEHRQIFKKTSKVFNGISKNFRKFDKTIKRLSMFRKLLGHRKNRERVILWAPILKIGYF